MKWVTELHHALDSGGLRLSSAVLGFCLGLALLLNQDVFNATPSYIALRPYPEWAFGLFFWVMGLWQILSKRGFPRRSSLIIAGMQWLFWSIFIAISTKAINTGSAVYLGISLLTFYEFYRETRDKKGPL